jgi:hypothetical protein
MEASEIELANFRLLVQCLDKLRHHLRLFSLKLSINLTFQNCISFTLPPVENDRFFGPLTVLFQRTLRNKMRPVPGQSTWSMNMFTVQGEPRQNGPYPRRQLRCCATNRKIAGSIPASVSGIFHWPKENPPDRTVALGSTQPLTEMNTRSISWWVKAAGA